MNSLEIIIIKNVIFAEAVRPPILEMFWQKQRSSGNNCINIRLWLWDKRVQNL